MVGKYVDELEDEPTRTTLTKKYLACVNAGETIPYVSEFYLPSGHKIFHSMLSPLKDENGRIYKIMVISRDITDEANETTKLRQSEHDFKTLVENLADIFARYDANGRFVYVNQKFEQALGVKLEDIKGKKPSEINGLPEAGFFESMVKQSVTSGKSSEFEHKISFVSGEFRWAIIRITPEFDANNQLCFVQVVSRDISKRKALEDELAKKERYQRTLLDNFPFFVWLKDKNGKLLAANTHYARIAKVDSVSELEGKTDFDFFPHKLAQKYITDDKEVMDSGRAKTLEEPCLDESGELTVVQTWKAPLIINGEVVGTVGFAKDITEEKEANKMLYMLSFSLNKSAESGFIVEMDTAKIIYANDTASKVLGHSTKELTSGMRVYDIDPDYKHPMWDTHISELKIAKNMIFETKHMSKNGRIYPVEVHSSHFEYDGKDYIWASSLEISERNRLKEALQHSERIFRTLTENTPDTIARYGANCERLYANPALANAMGLSQQDMLCKKPTSYNKTEQAISYEEAIKKAFTSGKEDEIEYQWMDINGKLITSHIRLVPEKMSDGQIVSVMAVGRDITSIKEYEEKLQQSEARLKEAQRIAKLGSWEFNFTTQALFWSDEIYNIFELRHLNDTLQYDDFMNCIHPDDRELVNGLYMESVKNKTIYNVIHRLLMPDGRIKYIHEKGETFYDENGVPTYSVGTAQDITEQKEAEQKIEFLTNYDSLTNLPNMVLAKDRAEQAIEYAKRNGSKVALLVIDIDGFKLLNDSLGHSTGDLILKVVASRMQECIRGMDTISRQGGDEFLIVLPDIEDVDSVAYVVERILKEVECPLCVKTHVLSVTVSIGIATYPECSDSFGELLQKADTAMYKAKEDGKNTYRFYNEQMNLDVMSQLKLQNDLKKAITNNEFVLYYQPQICLTKNDIIGVEALIRWRHPTLGMVPPNDFIPLAESSGLIVQIGEWVIKEACRQAAQWHAQNMLITVAVNISAVQFKRGNLESVVKEALEMFDLDPKFLELELTESIMMHDSENVLQAVQRLKAIGVQLSIDDFGTGYSSLAYLKRFAVDKLKIDQSFVRDMHHDEDDAAIIKAIIQMAKSLRLKTIAEGVENEHTICVLNDYGCDEAQGYHYARPLEVGMFMEYYEKNFA